MGEGLEAIGKREVIGPGFDGSLSAKLGGLCVRRICPGLKPGTKIDIPWKVCHIKYDFTEAGLRISEFEWDEGNALHLELGHGIKPEEAEEVFAHKPLFKRTKNGHYVALGPTTEGRYLTVVFEYKAKCIVRPITAWDMKRAEIQYYKKHRR